jgi:hypothetical protein
MCHFCHHKANSTVLMKVPFLKLAFEKESTYVIRLIKKFSLLLYERNPHVTYQKHKLASVVSIIISLQIPMH